ncbi:MAG: extracellular solute-binding protein [bacterium]|nr:extracellular solute-binding protein [bacterium]
MLENKKLLIGIGAGIFILIIVLVIVFTRKTGTNNNQNNGITDLGAGTVTLWTPIGDEAAYAPFIERLQDQDVVLNIVAKNPATYEDDLVNAIAAGQGPDIFLLKDDWVVKRYGMIYPIPYQKSRYSDTVKDFKNLYPSVVAQQMIGAKGDIFGYPISSDPLVLYTNRTIFDNLRMQLQSREEGIDEATDALMRRSPTTWDEFKTVSKMLTIKNGTLVSQAGAALGTDNNIESAQDILYLLMLQNGTQFASSDGKSATFQLQQKAQSGADWYPGTSALDFYTSFASPASDVYSWNESMPNATEYFIQGKLAMMVDYASRENYIKQMNPNLEYGVDPLPQVRQSLIPNGFMHYWAFSVNKNSKVGNLAWGVISVLMGENDRSKYLTASGRYPIMRDDLGSGGAGTIEGQITRAKTIYKPDLDKYNTIMLKMINDATHSKQPLQSSIEAAARDITALLK